MILAGLNIRGAAGIYGVAVKCINTIRNTDSGGMLPFDD